MARIRTVKPKLFRHEKLFEAEIETGLPLRLAFIGLFTCCDREGRFGWFPRQLKLDVFPYDDIDFSRVLDALWTRGFVKKYVSDGEEFGLIPTFHKHQVINNREHVSELPDPCNCTIIDASATREPRDTVTTEGNREGNGEGNREEERDSVLRTGADAPSVVEFPKAEKLNPANDGHPSWWPRRDRYGYLPAGIDEKITFDVGVAILGQKSRGLIAKLVKLYEYDYRGVTDILLQSESKNEPTEWIGGVLRKLPHERPMARHVQYPEDAYRGAL